MRKSVDHGGQESGLCYFCNVCHDSPEHQLLQCKEVKETTHNKLVENIINGSNYLEEVFIPRSRYIQLSFIDRIKFLMEQHEGVEEAI